MEEKKKPRCSSLVLSSSTSASLCLSLSLFYLIFTQPRRDTDNSPEVIQLQPLMKSSPTEPVETTMLRACYGNRYDRCEAFTFSAEFVAMQQPLSLHCKKGCIMLSHDQQTAAVQFSHFTQNNGSFPSSRTQRGFPGCSMKSHLIFSIL